MANTFQTGYSKRLSIGYCASFFAKGIGDYFNLLRPDVEIYYTKLQYPDMLSSLLSGDIDIMAYGGFAAKDLAREPFGYKIFGNYPQLLRCLPTNPLAKKAEVSIDDLRGQHLLMLSPLIAPMWLNYVTDLCIQERFLPQVAMYVDEVTSLAMNLRYDDQAFIADYAVSFEKFDIVSVPIKNTSCGFMLAWNKEKTNAVVKEFLAASESYFKELERQGYFSDFRK